MLSDIDTHQGTTNFTAIFIMLVLIGIAIGELYLVHMFANEMFLFVSSIWRI
jgi:hypothetical protein